MTTRELTRPRGTTFEAEGGGWLVLRRPQPDLRGATPAEWLARGRELPGDFRYVPDHQGGVLLLGLAGGWLLVSGSLRPLREISDAAAAASMPSGMVCLAAT